jgi:hypothetical protein
MSSGHRDTHTSYFVMTIRDALQINGTVAFAAARVAAPSRVCGLSLSLCSLLLLSGP